MKYKTIDLINGEMQILLGFMVVLGFGLLACSIKMLFTNLIIITIFTIPLSLFIITLCGGFMFKKDVFGIDSSDANYEANNQFTKQCRAATIVECKWCGIGNESCKSCGGSK